MKFQTEHAFIVDLIRPVEIFTWLFDIAPAQKPLNPKELGRSEFTLKPNCMPPKYGHHSN